MEHSRRLSAEMLTFLGVDENDVFWLWKVLSGIPGVKGYITGSRDDSSGLSQIFKAKRVSVRRYTSREV